jgi:hypothetical protein
MLFPVCIIIPIRPIGIITGNNSVSTIVTTDQNPLILCIKEDKTATYIKKEFYVL